MKILQITPCFLPRPGGIGRYVYNLSEELTAAGHSVEIAATDIPVQKEGIITIFKEICSRKPIETNYDKYKLTLYPTIAEPLGNPLGLYLSRIKEQVKENDIVHLHGVYFYLTVRSVMMMRRYRDTKQLVITHHGRIVYDSLIKNVLVKIYEKTCVRYILKKADNIVVLSNSDKQQLSQIAPVEEKITVLPNGINTSVFNRPTDAALLEFKNKYSIERSKKIILFVSVITTRKGIFDLLDAFATIDNKENLVLFVIGNGPEYATAVNKSIELGLEGCVIFTGKISFEDLLCAYAVSDVYVLPSYFEGMPTTIIEALSMGTPVVATDIPGVSDNFSEYVSLVKPHNIEELASELLKITGAKFNELSDVEIMDIREKFDAKNVFKKYLSIYKTC